MRQRVRQLLIQPPLVLHARSQRLLELLDLVALSTTRFMHPHLSLGGASNTRHLTLPCTGGKSGDFGKVRCL